MRENYRYIAIALFLVFMTSCYNEKLSEQLVPKEESAFAKEYLSKLRERDFQYIKSVLSPELSPQVNDELLNKMADHFRSGDLISVEIIGSQVNVFNDQWQGNFTFEYKFESGWNLANTALRKTVGGYEVIGLNVYQTEASQKEINAFSLSSKTPFQYFVLVLAFAVPVFILFTLVMCIKTPIPQKKWLWIVFVLLGVGSIKVDWTSGAYALQLFNFSLFGASATTAGLAAPWIISASIPLGAIVFWFKRRKFISLAIGAGESSRSDINASAD